MRKPLNSMPGSDLAPNDPQCGYLQLFDSITAENPNRIAIVGNDEEIAYQVLQQQAAAIGSYLKSLNLDDDALIGICLPRQAMLITAMLGVHAAGFAYVPIDPGFPGERSRFVLEDAGVAVLLSTAELAEAVAPPSVLTVLMDEQWSDIEQMASSSAATASVLQNQQYSPDRLAYIIYTSGSTGKPKGVRVTCGNLSNFLQSMRRCPGLDAGQRVLALTTVAFDIAQLELFLPLISGATVCIAPRSVSVDGFALAEFIQKYKVTLAQATPSTWRLLQAADWPGNPDLIALCGGESLNPELAGWLLGRVKKLWNMYGPTETTVWSSCGLVSENAVRDERISIGQAIDNTSLYLRRITDDENDWQVCDLDEPGELLIGGIGVADGYHNRPELTARQFIDNPFLIDGKELDTKPGFDTTGTESPVLYCTGDLVSVDADGNYSCFGRIDNQMKLRGFRIEPGEIETVIENHAAVSSAAVTLHNHNNSEHLVAYLVTPLNDTDELSQLLLELRAMVGAKLPAYMAPRVYARLHEMPLTPNAKLDRKALPDADSENFKPIETGPDSAVSAAAMPQVAKSSATHSPPDSQFTPTESEIAKLWSNLTGQPVNHSASNFFDVGGHSLLAMKFLSELREKYTLQLPFRCITTDNLSQIAARVDGSHNEAGPSSIVVEKTTRSEGYIENGRRRVFYQIHAPADVPSRGAVLIVPPLAHESMRIHRELFLLAQSLAANGLTVMRFDLSATGHSALRSEEIQFNDWLEDVSDAAQYLCSLSNHTTIDLVGVRGAALLMKRPDTSAHRSFKVGRMVLFDPVFNGAEYIRELTSLTEKVLADLDRFRWRINARCDQDPGSDKELMGQVYSSSFLQQLGDSDFADAASYVPTSGQHIVASSLYPVSAVGQLAVGGGSLVHSDWQIHHSASSIEWFSAKTVDAMIVTPDSLNIIQELLS